MNEKTNFQLDEQSQLIVVKQIPVIIEKLESVKTEIERKVNAACSMVCTEDNYKEIKKIRSALNKELAEFENQRKAVKTEVMTPYERFEDVYKNCISGPYKQADSELKRKISDIEQGLKNAKYEKAKAYFDEYSHALGIDFIKLEQVGLNITMTVTIKKLRESIKAFLDKVMDDLKLISTQEHKDEILYEYKRSLNVSNSITTVNERFRAIEEEKARVEAERVEREKAELNEQLNIREYEPFSANLPNEVAPPAEELSDEKIYPLTFTVYGTKSQLGDFAAVIKQLINERGLKYE